MPHERLLPLDLTYIVYNSNSLLSFVLALVTLAPLVIGIVLVTLSIARRELEPAYLLFGLACSTIINSVVKNYVQDPRPVGSTKSGFGFPSDHAQFMGFFAVYLALWIFSERVNFNQFLLAARTTQIDGTDILTTIYIAPPHREANLIENRCNVALLSSVAWKTLITVFIVACAVIVMWSRVNLGVHSDRQVYAGAMLGIGLGIVWHLLARFIAWPIIFPWIERSAIGRMMYLQDCGAIPHILRFEWMTVQSFKQGVREKRKLT